MDRDFLQLVGTAMGTKVAPPYANLFIGRHEEAIREAFIWAIPFWKRFIDDIFLIFLGTTKQLHSMKDLMDNLYPMIKFTFEHSTQEIFFLDLKIYTGADRKLTCNIFNQHLQSSPTTSSKLSSALVTQFSNESPRHQVP